MKIFKNKKIIYMVGLSIITLLAFVISPTYAKFIDSYVSEDTLAQMDLSFDIGITGIDEYHEVVVPANDKLKFNVQIDNDGDVNAYYGVWYKMVVPGELPDDDSIQIGRLDGTEISTSGDIESNGSKTVTVGIINNSSTKIKLYIGVASSVTSTSDIEYLNGKRLITGDVQLEVLLSDYVMSLYNDGSTINTVNIGGDTTKPQVSLNATQGIMLDNNGIYRYYGASPNNYVWYNDELWRIISVENVKSSATDTVGETRVKIVKADILKDDNNLSAYSWDSSASTVNSGYGVNDWSKSDLMTELNTLYFNSTSGTCYTGSKNATTDCNFTNTGLSPETKSLTADALYYLGGSSTYSGLYADDYYNFERGTTVWGSTSGQTCSDGACPRATTWTGRVGIIYPSDYAYATDLSLCTSDPYNYESDDNCYGKDWLLSNDNDQWTISPRSDFAYRAFYVHSVGCVDSNYVDGVSYAGAVRPVQYLRSDVAIVSGEGTDKDPYKIARANDNDTIEQNEFAKNIMSPNAISDENIDFSKTSDASGTNGIYMVSETANDTYPIYYYRGNVNNNLIFANTCWKVVRTTETGGLKLLYNGTPTDGQCNNTGAASQIGTKEFNSSYDSAAYVGYMYSSPYSISYVDLSSSTDIYYYANDVTYSNGTYTLVDSDIKSGVWTDIYSELGNYHYTCFSTSKTCENVYYMTSIDKWEIYYITLTGGKKVEDALTEMLGADDENTDNYNTISSTIKGNNTTEGTLDWWYYNNIEQKGYSSYIEDTVWCNDRTISSLGAWDPDGGSLYGGLRFSAYKRIYTTKEPSLTCTRNIDSFTVSEANGNGDLDYPVGLLTSDEIMLAGGIYSSNKTYYLYSGNYYWAGSPVYITCIEAEVYGASVSYVYYDGTLGYDIVYGIYDEYGVRPSVSLKTGFSLTGNGDGTAENPYVVN